MLLALINPPSEFLIDDTVMPPLGIMYLSSYLKTNGYEPEIIDLAIKPDDIQSKTFGMYDIYAITATTPQYDKAVKIRDKIKAINKNSICILGGAHATSFPEKCLDKFDVVIQGEGEKALLAVINDVNDHSVHSACSANINQCTHKYKNNKETVNVTQISDINTIPFPDRNFQGFNKYNYNINGLPATTMLTSRGCPFHCYFCCNTWGNNVRLRSAKNVLEESMLLKNIGYKAIMFYDDTFTVNRNRVIEICKGLKEINMTWRCFIHAYTVDHDLLKLMYKSGCFEVCMGVESGNKNILHNVNKKINLDKVMDICNWCHGIGLSIKTFMMIGLPSESKETINDTIELLRHIRPNDYDITCYVPFPRTFIWDNKEQFDIVFDKSELDYSKMYYKGKRGQYRCQISTSKLTSKEIETARDYIEGLKYIICT